HSGPQFVYGDGQVGQERGGQGVAITIGHGSRAVTGEAPDLHASHKAIDDPVFLRTRALVEVALLDIVEVRVAFRDDFNGDIGRAGERASCRQVQAVREDDCNIRDDVVLGFLTPDKTRFHQHLPTARAHYRIEKSRKPYEDLRMLEVRA